MSEPNNGQDLISDEEIENNAKIFADNFKQMTEVEGVIIKGHIMLERELNTAIESTILNRKEYYPDKFSFSQKLILSQMLGISNNFAVEIKTWNTLRNQIAHSLKYDDKLINIITQEITKKHPTHVISKDSALALGYCVSFICGGISIRPPYARKILALEIQIETLKKENKK